MATPILLKNPTVWFIYIDPTEHTRGIWLNLALVTQISEYVTTDTGELSVKILMIDSSTLIFHGARALTIIQELGKISGIQSKTGFSLLES